MEITFEQLTHQNFSAACGHTEILSGIFRQAHVLPKNGGL